MFKFDTIINDLKFFSHIWHFYNIFIIILIFLTEFWQAYFDMILTVYVPQILGPDYPPVWGRLRAPLLHLPDHLWPLCRPSRGPGTRVRLQVRISVDRLVWRVSVCSYYHPVDFGIFAPAIFCPTLVLYCMLANNIWNDQMFETKLA